MVAGYPQKAWKSLQKAHRKMPGKRYKSMKRLAIPMAPDYPEKAKKNNRKLSKNTHGNGRKEVQIIEKTG